MKDLSIKKDEINSLFSKLNKEAEQSGYHLNPDREFTGDLIRGLLVNKKRYGYLACPCRLASGIRDEDLDIICPCDYRDPDLTDYDACYCALYVSEKIISGVKKANPIPERRIPLEQRTRPSRTGDAFSSPKSLAYPVWRCRVCGYLCAREFPPAVCPVCRADKDRFERFM